jgi:aspartate racemase
MKTIGLIEAACSLEKGGADFAFICTNTMHKLYDEVQARIQIPLMHIADATAEAIISSGIISKQNLNFQ